MKKEKWPENKETVIGANSEDCPPAGRDLVIALKLTKEMRILKERNKTARDERKKAKLDRRNIKRGITLKIINGPENKVGKRSKSVLETGPTRAKDCLFCDKRTPCTLLDKPVCINCEKAISDDIVERDDSIERKPPLRD